MQPTGRTQPACASEHDREGFTATPAWDARRTGSHRRMAWIATLALVVAFVVLLQTSLAQRTLTDLGARSRSTGFTEVSIEQAPTTTVRGKTLRVAFAVSIHDVGDGGAYRWALETTAAKAVGSPPSGSLSLEAGERVAIPVRAAVRCDARAARAWVGVRVDPEPAASVGTWLDCPERQP